MDLISEYVQLTLTYIAAANRAGARLTVEALEAFAAHPRQAPGRATGTFARLSTIGAVLFESEPDEAIVHFLTRARWINIAGDSVTITPLGKAVLANAERPPLLDPADEPLSVTIDPDDRLAYTKIFDLLSSYGEGLLIDPYLRLGELGDVIAISSIDKVLTSNRVDNHGNRLNLLAHALGATDSPPQVRMVDAALLHDRFFIPDDGPVYIFGSSLNTIAKRPGVLTPIADSSAAAAIRAVYAEMWAGAERLAAIGSDVGPGVTAIGALGSASASDETDEVTSEP